MIKALLIYNPKAGRSLRRPPLSEILSLFPRNEFDIKAVVTEADGAAPVVEKYAAGMDEIIVCGGDGTLNEAIGGLMKIGADIPVGYIPIGSTNDLADALNIPEKVSDAVAVIRKGETHTLDIGGLNGRVFNYVACFGPGTAVSYSTPQKMKNKLGYGAYMINGFILNAIPTLKSVKPIKIRIERDGVVTEGDYYFGAVSNATTVAGMIHYDRNDLSLNDGLFEVILVRKLKHKTDFFRILHRMMHRQYDDDCFLCFKTDNIRMQFNCPVDWSIDGECLPRVTDAEIKVQHNAVRIFCPDSGLLQKRGQGGL